MTTKRTHTKCPTRPSETMKRLLHRGVAKVNTVKVAESYDNPRTPEAVANNIRAALFMAGNGMLRGKVKTEINAAGVMTLRLIEDATPDFPEKLPRVITKMVENGNKFTPTVADALAARGFDVEVNPQAKELSLVA